MHRLIRALVTSMTFDFFYYYFSEKIRLGMVHLGHDFMKYQAIFSLKKKIAVI